MALIAFLNSDNLVEYVVQSPEDGQDWAQIYAERNNCICIETSEDGSFRSKRAVTGDKYYPDLDAFIGPQPYPSWSLNTTTKQWEAPVEMPDDELIYQWNETKQNWIIVWDPIWDTRSFPTD